jgi:hypothetical protein
MLNIPVFKNMQPEVLEVETFAQINGREVSFVLLSPAANQIIESVRDCTIDGQLSKIADIAPNIVIIES